jgi:RNA-binding protein
MDEKTRKQRSEGKLLEPSIIIGKNGYSEEVIKNIKDKIKKNQLIKIKILKTFIEGKDKKEIARDLAEKTNSNLIDLVGFNVVLGKKN